MTAKLFLIAVLLLQSSSPAYGQHPIASFFYDERGSVVRQEQDTNGDGKMDRWTFYNKQGQVERVEQDLNFDGKADTIAFYEGGRPVRQEVSGKTIARSTPGFSLTPTVKSNGAAKIPTAQVGPRFGFIIRTASRCAVRKIPN